MNPVTQALTARLTSPEIIEFIQHWDALEALIIRVFRSKVATPFDETEYTATRTWLHPHYGDWRETLGVYWPQTKIAKQPAVADPFDTLLAPEQASEFIGNWSIMQALPAARESLNHLILDMQSETNNPTQQGYDAVAVEYAVRIYNELASKPLDRRLLDDFADRVRGRGQVCDMGCGPGHVTRYLHEQGVDIFGADLSPGMVAQARQLNPGIRFETNNILDSHWPDQSLAGIVVFYSLIHIPREQIPQALRELYRVLSPDGLLFAAFHIGSQTVHMDEWWGKPVSLDFAFFEREEMENWLHAAGFTIQFSLLRAPYASAVEHQSQRAYILCGKDVK